MHGGRELDPIFWSIDLNSAIDAELGERLLHVVLEEGSEWSGLPIWTLALCECLLKMYRWRVWLTAWPSRE